MATDFDWTPAPWEWAASRHDYLDGHAREASAVSHENVRSARERRGFIALRVQLARQPEPQRYIPHSMRYV
jgi:hypothetical protein